MKKTRANIATKPLPTQGSIDTPQQALVADNPASLQMADIMKVFEQSQANENTKSQNVLRKLMAKEIGSKNLSALIVVGATSLLPENQPMELRFLSIAQIAANLSDFNQMEYIDLKKVYKCYDKHFGSYSEMSEIDNQQQLYISWVKFGGQYYQTFTGTFGDGEVYLQNIIRKYEIIKTALPSSKKGTEIALEWVLSKVDRFIDDTGLSQYAQSNGADYKLSTIQLDDRVKNIASQLSSDFTLEKDHLPHEVSMVFKKLSKKPNKYKDGSDEFYKTPIVDYGSHYVAPFPQLLLSALLQSIFEEATETLDENAAKNHFVKGIKIEIAQLLKIFFGEKKVLEDLTIHGQPWADFCVKYDGKLLLISVEVGFAGEDISDAVTETTQRMFKLRTTCMDDEQLEIQSLNGVHEHFAEDIRTLEPIVLTLVDTLSEFLVFGMGNLEEEALHDVITVDGFEYIIHQLTSPIEFIRYLRAVDDLRKRKIRMPGATALDLFAMYIEGNHQLREIEQDPDMLMIDFSSGAHLIT